MENNDLNDVMIYIDESGNTSIRNTEGENRFYIIVLIVVKQEYSKTFEKQYLEIVKKYNKNTFLKYGKFIKMPHKEDFLNDLIKLNFSYITVSVDKSILFKDGGFEYKRSFYKYFHKLALKRIENIFGRISIKSDTYTDDDFHDSFVEYLKKNSNSPSLFKSIEFIKRDEVIQLSDIIAGLFRNIKTNKSPVLDSLKNIISNRELQFINFPNGFLIDNNIDHESNETYNNNEIYLYTLKMIQKNFEALTEDTKLVLFYLIAELESNPNKFIYSNKLISLIQKNHGKQFSKNQLKMIVFKELRNNNIDVCGSSRGYKLPFSLNDYKVDFELNRNNAIPALIKINNYTSRLATNLGITRKELLEKFSKENDLELLKLISEKYGGIYGK